MNSRREIKNMHPIGNLVFINIILSKYFFHLTILLVTFFSALPRGALAGEMNIHVGNRGDIPVYVAAYTYAGLLQSSRVTGWWKIEPSAFLEPRIIDDDTWGYYYFAFAIRDRNGRLGVVGYQPRKKDALNEESEIYIAVDPNSSFDFKENYRNLQQERTGRVLIPFTWSVSAPTHNKNYFTEITLRPSIDDKIIMYLEDKEDRAESSPSRRVPISTWRKLVAINSIKECHSNGTFTEYKYLADGKWEEVDGRGRDSSGTWDIEDRGGSAYLCRFWEHDPYARGPGAGLSSSCGQLVVRSESRSGENSSPIIDINSGGYVYKDVFSKSSCASR